MRRCSYSPYNDVNCTDIGTINTRLECVQELLEKEVTTLLLCVCIVSSLCYVNTLGIVF